MSGEICPHAAPVLTYTQKPSTELSPLLWRLPSLSHAWLPPPLPPAGNISVGELRSLLQDLGGGGDTPAYVVITDVREELVVYVNGTPYLR